MDSHGQESDSFRTPNETQLARAKKLYEALQSASGTVFVVFSDKVTPSKDHQDPNKKAYFAGEVLDIGADNIGYWAMVRVFEHSIQKTSYEKVSPGFINFLETIYSSALQSSEIAAELQALEREYPDTAEYVQINDYSNEPVKFYLHDMHGCNITSQY